MNASPFVSYAQNGEDVVLWRALRHVEGGRYVDVGANSPEDDSVTKVFYDAGWSGIDVEPMAEFAEQLRQARPRDVVVEAAVSQGDTAEVVLHEFPGTGLSTVRDDYVAETVERGFEVQERRVAARTLQDLVDEHLPGEQVHFCKIDVEGAEGDVLASVDLTQWRPWVLVVEATRPNSAEPTHESWDGHVRGAGYAFCLFDGLSRWYVAEEHAQALAPALSYPACSLDDYVRAAQWAAQRELRELQRTHHRTVQDLAASAPRLAALEEEVALLRHDLVRWRGAALERWAGGAETATPRHDGSARLELEAMRRTLSWRITAPLRSVRARQLRQQA